MGGVCCGSGEAWNGGGACVVYVIFLVLQGKGGEKFVFFPKFGNAESLLKGAR